MATSDAERPETAFCGPDGCDIPLDADTREISHHSASAGHFGMVGGDGINTWLELQEPWRFVRGGR